MHYHGPRGDRKDDREVNYRETYFRLLKFARPYLPLIIIVLFLALAGSFIGVLPDQVLGVAVDNIFSYGQRSNSGQILEEREQAAVLNGERAQDTDEELISPEDQFTRMLPITPYIERAVDYMSNNWMREYPAVVTESVTLALVFIILFILSRLLTVIQGFITVYVGQSLIFDLRGKVYGHLQKLSFKYYENNRTGDIMARVVNDVDSLADMIINPVIDFVRNVSALIFVLYFCLLWDWRLTLLALIAAPLLIITTRFFGLKFRKNFRRLRKRIGDLNGLLQDNIAGIRVIKGFTREDYEYERFEEKNRKNYQSRLRLGILFRTFRPIIDFLNQVGTIVVLGYGSLKVYAGSISPGIFVTFIRYLPRLYNPITGFSRFYNQIQQALASCERVFEVMDIEPEIKDDPDAIDLKEVQGLVEFDDVSFSYDEEVEVLKDINITVKPGEMAAFVGPSGAGKTTLTNLIPRFYDPTRGKIKIDGYDLKKIKAQTLRSHIGIVQQDPFLFNDTLLANINYGKLDADEDEVKQAARAANCDNFIEEMPKGFNTVIGERGVKLSGGQKQRVSIARAILADPKILILDEATSSVDTETEILIQKAIDHLVQDRTTFVIAHRLSTIQGADNIIVMDKGMIVETGTHQELINNDGLYSKLHQLQFTSLENNDNTKEEFNSGQSFPDLNLGGEDDIF